jgi:hypothetical protein
MDSHTSCAAARRATARQPSAVSAYPWRSRGVADWRASASIKSAWAKHSIDVSIPLYQTQFDPLTETWQLDPVFLTAGIHTIYVNGNLAANGSYVGNINVTTSVPEPGTWAMLLLGFGAVGFALRRRRLPVLAQAA